MASLRSWFSIPHGSHFSLANLPFGIITHAGGSTPRPAVAIGAHALDLDIFTANSGFRDLSTIQPHSHVFSSQTLNAFAALGRPIHAVVRRYLQSVFLADTPYPEVLRDNPKLQKECLIPLTSCTNHLPLVIGDYTDFYAGLHHARNAGTIIRGAANALQANYRHMPIAYHSRASSVVVSGTPIRRPRGQILQDPKAQPPQPVDAPSRRLDIELELAAFVCKDSTLGERVSTTSAEAEYVFGVVLMNDWSARDIQAWEYVPLGPFNAKNFGTTISPWVVLADALAPFRVEPMPRHEAADSTGAPPPPLLPYLHDPHPASVYDINVSATLTTSAGASGTLTSTNARNLLFSFPQMLAHHTSTGCNVRVGDLIGSGTISGAGLEENDPGEQCGSLMERSRGGRVPTTLSGGRESEAVQRTWLEDGDTVTISGCCGTDPTALVGFGECAGRIMPALE